MELAQDSIVEGPLSPSPFETTSHYSARGSNSFSWILIRGPGGGR